MTSPFSLTSGQGGAGFSSNIAWKYESQTVADPNSGSDWSFTVPSNKMYELLYITGILTTSALVGNRLPSVAIVAPDGSSLLAHIASSGASQPASTSEFWTWQTVTMVNQSFPDKFTGFTKVVTPLAGKYILLPSMRIQVSTSGIRGTDQWTSCALSFRSYSSLNPASIT